MQRLSDSVTEFLRSTVIITGLSAAAEELIVNSLDAGAQHVQVCVDFSSFSLQVKDDGQGIPFHVLQELLGTRYVSSKGLPQQCSQAAGQQTYGCRGEALSSLGCVSDVNIVSRFVGSTKAFHKRIRFGECMPVERCASPFEHGTVVSVNRLFENVPVRQRTCQARAEQVKLRDFVRRLAILHHTVSFTLTDSATRKVLVSTKPQVSVAASFMALFGSQTLTKMQETATEQEGCTLAGLLSPPFHEMCVWSKDTQLLYINNRWMRNTDTIGKFINQVYTATLRTKDITTTRHHSGEEKGIYPCFILHFTCPVEDVDILSEPDKSTAIFRRPEIVEACVKQLVQGMFARYRPDKAAMIARVCALRGTDPEMFEIINDEPDRLTTAQEALPPVVAVPSPTPQQYTVRNASPISQGVSYTAAFFPSPPEEHQHNMQDCEDEGGNTTPAQLVPEYGVSVSRPSYDIDEHWGAEAGLFSQYTYATPQQHPQVESSSANDVQRSILSEVVESLSQVATPSNALHREDIGQHMGGDSAEELVAEPECERVATEEEILQHADESPPAAETVLPPSNELITTTASSSPEVFTCSYPREAIGAQTLQLPLNLDKRLLDDCITIGQSDRKYIIVTSSDQLLALDQHAADERLRLERFEARLDVNKGNGSVLKSIELHPPHVVHVAEATADVLEHAVEVFFHWNFKFELDRSTCAVSLLEVPVVTGEVLTASDFLEYVEFVSTRTGFPVSVLRPPAVTRILASKACRGAIMFGEQLTQARCAEIVDGLRGCNFPFQCAHGRPSIVPLFDVASAHRAKASRKRKAELPARFLRSHPY